LAFSFCTVLLQSLLITLEQAWPTRGSLPGFMWLLTWIPHLFVWQNFAPIVHLNYWGATYTRIAWKRAWWLV